MELKNGKWELQDHEKSAGLTKNRFEDHHGYYMELAGLLGIGWPETNEKFMGKTKSQWKELYDKDEHLNNHPLMYFDMCHDSHKSSAARIKMPISLSDTVCMLKAVIKDRVNR